MATPRIIAGTAKGIRLKDVPGDSTRPITDRVKEALFNILGIDIVEATILDLFGGTGSVGLEAISRGAKLAIFIENNHMAFQVIKENILLTKAGEKAVPKLQDAFAYLNHPDRIPYSYIFIAPPQYKKLWEKSLFQIDAHPEYLEDGGSLIVQIDPVEYADLHLDNFKVYESRKYGSTLLVFYEKS